MVAGRSAGRSAARHVRPPHGASGRRRSRILRTRHGQARAGGDGQRLGIFMRGDVGERNLDLDAGAADEEGGQHPCDPREPDRRRRDRRVGRGSARNGPFSGVARSNCGSASAVAAAKSTQGARSTSTAASGSAASSWLVSFSVAARPAEIRTGACPSGSKAAKRSGSAVSTASIGWPAIAIGQPRRSASIARAADLGSALKNRIPS